MGGVKGKKTEFPASAVGVCDVLSIIRNLPVCLGCNTVARRKDPGVKKGSSDNRTPTYFEVFQESIFI